MYYLLLGEDRVTKQEKISALLKKHAVPEEGPSRCVYFASEDSPEEIFNEAQTFPFFGATKAVIVHEAEKIPVPMMKGFFGSSAESTVLIFLSDKNVGKFSATVEKLFKQHGEVIMFWPMFENKLEQWVEKQAKTVYSMNPPRGLGKMLVEQCGRSTQLLESSLQTLSNYFGANEFSLHQAGSVAGEKKEITVFDLVDAVFSGRKAQALLNFRQLLFEGNEMLYMLIMLIRQLEQLWRGMEAGIASLKLAKIASAQLDRQQRKWDRGRLASVYVRLASLDRAVKTAPKAVSTAEFEHALIEICSACR